MNEWISNEMNTLNISSPLFQVINLHRARLGCLHRKVFRRRPDSATDSRSRNSGTWRATPSCRRGPTATRTSPKTLRRRRQRRPRHRRRPMIVRWWYPRRLWRRSATTTSPDTCSSKTTPSTPPSRGRSRRTSDERAGCRATGQTRGKHLFKSLKSDRRS